jgi:phage gpG-like protein
MSIKKIIQANESLLKVYRQTPRLVGGLAVAFFKQSFVRQGYIDEKYERWKPRKRADSGAYAKRAGKRGILVKTARLKRSIRVLATTTESVTVGTDVKYAQAHNEGFEGTVNQTVKQHNRKAHTRSRKGREEKVRAHKVQGFQRKAKMKIPKRQFMGDSKLLARRIQMNIEKLLIAELKKL